MIGYSGPPLRDIPAGVIRSACWYGGTLTFAAAGATIPLVLQLDGTYPFELTELAISSSDSPFPTTPAFLSITDTSNVWNFQNTPIPAEAICSTPTRIKPLAATYLFAPRAAVEVRITNNGTATQVVRLTFNGFKWVGAR